MENATLNVPKNSTLRFTCTVTGLGNIESYTGTLTVKENTKSTENKIQVDHDDITDNVITFVVPYSSNNIAAKTYVFGIYITNGTYRYSIDLSDDDVPVTVGIYNVLPVIG
jgi:hypothetical protein